MRKINFVADDATVMTLALEQAAAAAERGDPGFGAVVALEGEAVATAGSTEATTGDPLAHDGLTATLTPGARDRPPDVLPEEEKEMTDTHQSEAPPETIRVLTFNLLSPGQADWEPRGAVLEPALRELRPDVVAFQETVWGSGYDQATDLLGPDYEVVRHSGRSADGVGAVLASRWPFGTIREVDLHVTNRVDDLPWSAAIAAEVELPAPFGLSLFVHHKPTYQVGYAHERELQAVTCARFIENQLAGRDLHVVLLGDFDDVPDSSSLRFWTGRQALQEVSVAYRDAWEATHPGEPGHTFTPRNPLVLNGEWSTELGRRIDYILIRCGIRGPSLQIASCQTIFDDAVCGVWASDHFGVLADLRTLSS